MKLLKYLFAFMLLITAPAFGQISGLDPQLTFRETDQSLPNGLYRIRITGDAFTIEKNTSGTGNWGTYSTIYITTGGVVTAPFDASYITQIPNAALTAEQALSTLGTGLLKSTTGTGVLSIAISGTDYEAGLTFSTGLTRAVNTVSIDTTVVARKTDNLSVFANTTSAQLAGIITNETGSGGLVFDTTPTLITPRINTGLGLGGAAGTNNTLKMYGTSSGSITFAVPAAAGANTITWPAGTTDFSGTGGTSQFVKQGSSGGAFTVARPACADLSDSGTGCSGATSVFTGSVTANRIVVATANNVLGSVTSISAPSGGTGQTVYAVGDILYADSTTSLAKLADVATGSVLVSGGITTAPAYSASPTLTGLTLSGLTANNLVVTNGLKQLGSVASISAPSGGTGQTSYAVGDILYASTTTALSKLADVAVGAYLRSGGANTAPLYSTLVLPNSATANRFVYATATDTWGDSANATYNGTSFGFGTAINTSVQFIQGGAFTPAAGAGSAFRMGSTITGLANQNINGLEIFETIAEASSGTHGLEALLAFNSAVSAGAANADLFTSIYIPAIAAASGTTVASGINVAAPSGGTTNWAINSSGHVQLAGVTTASAATSSDTCFSTDEIVKDSALCIVSAMRFKHDIIDMVFGANADKSLNWHPITLSAEDMMLDLTAAQLNIEAAVSAKQPEVTSATNLLMKLRPVNYFLNEPSDFNQMRQQFGYVAEEVEALDNRLVTYQADGRVRSVLYISMIPVLNKGFQEHDARIEQLEMEVSALQAQIGGMKLQPAFIY